MSSAEDILNFWFGDPQDDKTYNEERSVRWFGSDPRFDQEIRDRFTTDYRLATEGKLADWRTAPRSSLALILLLDQFSRNIFRDDPRAFAADALAREVTAHLLRTNGDQQLRAAERMFVYMPLMHSEDLADQRQSVELFRRLAQAHPFFDGTLSYAVRHLETIERFGRFPHRNAVLGRPSTPKEIEFLTQPGSSFSAETSGEE